MTAEAPLPPALERVIAEVALLDPSGAAAARAQLFALRRRLDGERLLEFACAYQGAPLGRADWLTLRTGAARAALRRIEHRLTLAEIRRVLLLYAEAIARREVPIETTGAAGDQAATLAAQLPHTDGRALFLPDRFEALLDRRLNFSWYKVAVLFQLGLYESGTFLFRPGAGAERPAGVNPFDRFFRAQAEEATARALFLALEPLRVESFLVRRYPGIARDLAPVRGHALCSRPPFAALSPRAEAIERLVRFGLGEGDALPARGTSRIPVSVFAGARRSVAQVTAPLAVVDTTAAAIVELCPLVAALPGRVDPAAPPIDYRGALAYEWTAPTAAAPHPSEHPADPTASGAEGLVDWLDRLLRDGLGLLSLVDGELLAMALAERGSAGVPSPITAPAPQQNAGHGRGRAPANEQPELRPSAAAADDDAFRYDEWDHTLLDYRRRHCRLTETVLVAGDLLPIEALRQEQRDLLRRIRHQFLLLRPEALRTERGLRDGEELDFDRLVEARVDRHAGLLPNDDLYTLRRRQERDVAAALLVDLSASTGTAVAPESLPPSAAPAPPYRFAGVLDGGWDDDPLWGAPPLARRDATAPRRVIDVEREALVLFTDALAVLGDAHAVYGFSGYGREQVDFYVAKEFDDRDPGGCAARIAAMAPRQSTRMGPAIRHATRKLLARPERLRVLLLLSDGYPQDHDYGPDRTSREYGLRDTQQALREAEWLGVETFCITVDPAGHDYLRAMCPEGRYLVIDDLEALPGQLPKVYRRLTT